MSQLILCFSSQDTVVCMSDRDPANCQKIYINTQRQGEDITYVLTTYTLEDTQHWRKALCQHIYSMSEAWMNSLFLLLVFLSSLGFTSTDSQIPGMTYQQNFLHNLYIEWRWICKGDVTGMFGLSCFYFNEIMSTFIQEQGVHQTKPTSVNTLWTKKVHTSAKLA